MSTDNQSNTVTNNQSSAAAVKSPANPVLPVPKVVASKPGSVGPSSASASALTDALTGTLAVEPDMGEAAVARLQPLLDAIGDDEVVPRLNTSARNVAITALGAQPRILAMRPDAVRMLPNHDLIYIDCFEDLLLALLHSDTAVQMSAEDRKELAEKAVGFYAKRDQFGGLAHGFARFGQIDPAQIEVVGKEPGYRALARDLSILAKVFRQNWSKFGSGLPFTLQEVAQLDRDSLVLNALIGAKEQTTEAPREVNVLRRRIYTLFRMAIADLRRLAIYLYGEDAVDSIIPGFSNFAKSTRGGKGEEGADATQNTDSGLAVDANGVTPGAQAAPSSQAQSAPQRPSGFIVNNPENLPITNPFSDDEDAKESA
jgi:hypothetical protein